MVVDVDHEEPLEPGNPGAGEVAAFHDDGRCVLAGFFGDAIGNPDFGDSRKLHQRRRGRVGADRAHLSAQQAQGEGRCHLRSDGIAVGARVRDDDEPLPSADGGDDAVELRVCHR
jgi:hypothetical protein